MSLRNEWTFEYTGGEVAKAAEAKSDYHAQRCAWWEGERDQVVAELRESGLQVTEYEVTGGQRHNVQFDPKLTDRLSECASKVKQHSRDAERYEMFAQVLNAHPEKHLDLHPDDVDYFGLTAVEVLS